MTPLDKFLKKLRNVSRRKSLRRRNTFGYGVGTADRYVGQVNACAGEQTCAARFAESLKGIGDWQSLVKAARKQPVYCDPDGGVDQKTIVTNSSDFAGFLKELKIDAEVPAKTIMIFKNIVTSVRQDRQGDILEPQGAQLDMKMPLLWQHIMSAPIGKMLGVLDQNKKLLRVVSSILDNALGNDAAMLIEHGALRISHGFIPLEYDWMEEDEDTAYPWRGFRIRSYEMMEESVVSVPANVDAVIEAFSRDKFADPLAKQWAKGMFDRRETRGFARGRSGTGVLATVGANGTVEIRSAGVTVTKSQSGVSITALHREVEPIETTLEHTTEHSCGCGGKTVVTDEPAALTAEQIAEKKHSQLIESKMAILAWANEAEPEAVRNFGRSIENIAAERTRQAEEAALLASV